MNKLNIMWNGSDSAIYVFPFCSSHFRLLILTSHGLCLVMIFFSGDVAAGLREHLNISIFLLVVNTSQRARLMLSHLASNEYVQHRVISISSPMKLKESEISQIGRALCGGTDVIASIRTAQEITHRTTKRYAPYLESKKE